MITATVALPADSVEVRGWFKPCNDGDIDRRSRVAEIEAVTFNFRSDPVTTLTVFGFKDIIRMLNLSWVACNKQREDLDQYSARLARPEALEIKKDDKFDFKIVIASLPYTISIAFRATTTTENIKADLRTNLVRLSDYLPSRFYDSHAKSSVTKAASRLPGNIA